VISQDIKQKENIMAKKTKKKTTKTRKKTTKKSSSRPELKAEKRKITGRKVKQLRQQDQLPASVYGKGVKSLSLKTDLKTTLGLMDKVGETGLVDLKIKGLKDKRTVLLKNPQCHPVSGQLLHLDFHQVDLTEKVTADIPIELAGKAPAAESGLGVLVQTIDEIEIEALPTDLPEKYVIDVSGLKAVDDAVLVKDLKIDKDKVTLKTDKEQILAKIEPLTEEEEEPAPVEEEIAAEEEGVEVEGEEKKEKEEAKEEEKPVAPQSAKDQKAGKPAEKEPAPKQE
jgi:large subunit ribosomal protein L25